MMKSIVIILAMLAIFPHQVLSQETFSWNDLVGWNGYSQWTDYFIVSPAYFGPNALPVAELNTGKISNNPFLELLGEGHLMKGDNTYNLFAKYYHPFFDGKVAVEFTLVPVEYYNMSGAIRDERKVRNEHPKGIVVGDLTCGTLVQIAKDKDRFPDVVFEMFFRTASGGGLSDARYTDAPGYYFNLNFGKDIKNIPKYFDEFRWFASLGFTAWQVGIDNYMQNDAGMAGLGFLFGRKGFIVQNHLAGYMGYLSTKEYQVVRVTYKPIIYDGDQPFVYRLIITKQFDSMNFKFAYQHGLHDFKYNSLSIGLQINFGD